MDNKCIDAIWYNFLMKMLVKKDYSIYIVRCRDKTLYTGIAKDVKKRITIHNSGRGARYTKTRGPVKLVYNEGLFTCGNALKRERVIKKMSRVEKIEMIKAYKPSPTLKGWAR